jgi:hypothetical protein
MSLVGNPPGEAAIDSPDPPGYPIVNGSCLHLGREHPGWFHLQTQPLYASGNQESCGRFPARTSIAIRRQGGNTVQLNEETHRAFP